MSNLFEAALENDEEKKAQAEALRPLADLLRPKKLEDVVGQDHLIKGDAPLARMVEQGRMSSLIFWGPPG